MARHPTEASRRIHEATAKAQSVEARIREARQKGQYTGKLRRDLQKELDDVSTEENTARQLPHEFKCVLCKQLKPLSEINSVSIYDRTYKHPVQGDWRTDSFAVVSAGPNVRAEQLLWCDSCEQQFHLHDEIEL